MYEAILSVQQTDNLIAELNMANLTLGLRDPIRSRKIREFVLNFRTSQSVTIANAAWQFNQLIHAIHAAKPMGWSPIPFHHPMTATEKQLRSIYQRYFPTIPFVEYSQPRRPSSTNHETRV